MPYQIIRQDITQIQADAIVNTANPRPVIGDGVDAAIHAAAGPRLLAARRAIGEIDPGCCALTPGFRLKAKYVIHCVADYWIDGKHGEAELLRSAYDTALACAKSAGCRSVAFPVIGAGTYGYPKELAFRTALEAFQDFLLADPGMTIILAVFHHKLYELAGHLFDDVESYVNQNYVDEHHAYEYRHDRPEEFSELNRSTMYSMSEMRQADDTQDGTEADLSDEWEAEDDLLDGRGPVSRDALPRFSGPARPAPAAGRGQPAKVRRFSARTAPPQAQENIQVPAGPEERFAFAEELMPGKSFSELLMWHLRSKDLNNPHVYQAVDLSKAVFSKALSGPSYVPSKNTAMRLAIGLGLDRTEAEELLAAAGYTFSPASKADLVVAYYLGHGCHNYREIESALYEMGLPTLTKDS